METSNTHLLDRRAHQLFLASGAGCELGAWSLLPTTARDSGLGVSVLLFSRYPALYLLADGPLAAVVVWSRRRSSACQDRVPCSRLKFLQKRELFSDQAMAGQRKPEAFNYRDFPA